MLASGDKPGRQAYPLNALTTGLRQQFAMLFYDDPLPGRLPGSTKPLSKARSTDTVIFILSFIAAALYGVSSALLVRALGNAKPYHNRRLTFSIAAIAALLHALVVIHDTGLPAGLSLPLFTSLAATALTVVVLHIGLCFYQAADYLGIAVYPLAAISLLASQFYGDGSQIVGHAVQLHVFLSLLSNAVLSLAAAQAILVSIQRRFLAQHKPGGFMKALPPLDTTEKLLFTLLGAGFALLSFSLASGFFYLEDMLAQHLVHKTVLSCLAWAIFGVLLFGRWKFGWRGKRAVNWALAGFGMLVLAYFGSKLVLEVLLSNP